MHNQCRRCSSRKACRRNSASAVAPVSQHVMGSAPTHEDLSAPPSHHEMSSAPTSEGPSSPTSHHGSSEQLIEETFAQIMEATSKMDQRSFQEFAHQLDKLNKLARAEMVKSTQLSPHMKACRASHTRHKPSRKRRRDAVPVSARQQFVRFVRVPCFSPRCARQLLNLQPLHVSP